MGALTTGYLVLYNAASAAGWGYLIYQIAMYYAAQKPSPLEWHHDTLYDEIGDTLKIVQTSAILEVLHAAFGLVRSPVMTTAIQGMVVSHCPNPHTFCSEQGAS